MDQIIILSIKNSFCILIINLSLFVSTYHCVALHRFSSFLMVSIVKVSMGFPNVAMSDCFVLFWGLGIILLLDIAYALWIINHAMRIFCRSFLFFTMFFKSLCFALDFDLKNGLHIPAVALLVAPLQLVQMDEFNWQSDAGKFNPYRFLTKSEKHSKHRSSETTGFTLFALSILLILASTIIFLWLFSPCSISCSLILWGLYVVHMINIDWVLYLLHMISMDFW